MRPIKFRAWDTVMQNWVVFVEEQIEIQKSNRSGYFKLKQFDPPRFILMQFTGLCDKNGKEIYEGDIVRNHWTNVAGIFIGDLWIVKFGDYDDSEIEYGSPAIGFYGENQGGEQQGIGNIPCDNGISIEVIGNIYENPELLKDK